MRFEKVGIFFKKLSRLLLAAKAGKLRSADQCGDIRRQGRGRVAAALFPSLLRSGGTLTNQILRRFQNHWRGIKIFQSSMFVQAPGQKNGKSDPVELNSMPVGGPIDPEVLVEAAVRTLRSGQVNERPVGGLKV